MDPDKVKEILEIPEPRTKKQVQACCLRQYILSYTTWLVSKMDPVKYNFKKPALTGRIAWWQPMHPEFPNEDIMTLFEEEVEDEDMDKLIVWFDGASNALGHGIGAVLVSPNNQYIPFMARLCFDCTNNIAEYEACTLGIHATIDFRVKLLKVYGDSSLVIHQLKGEWETRDHKLVPYQAYIRKLMELLDDISFHHIPREENQMADALASLSSMFKVSPHGDFPYIEFRCRGEPTHCYLIEEEEEGKTWYFDIKRYIESKEYPLGASDNDKRTLRRLAIGFILSGNMLYK
ncbi:uncharacterized protein [Glycine max]|uniref:uncharacterized protein n=1 Tax=Glycine max TaxID=3847 RepID=UPI0003DE9607|nr:uncharacterized protein LOC102668085 [Glycine max]|eukprot:XP_006603476.1 uncharacterized protein LOC102668085 [Glycine max]